MIGSFTPELAREIAVGVVGMALLAGTVGLLLGLAYRWVTMRAPPTGTTPVAGLTAVALYLTGSAFNTRHLLADLPLDHHLTAGYLLGTFLAAGLITVWAGEIGDRIGCQAIGLSPIDADGDAAETIRSSRLGMALDLPGDIGSVEGYRAVDDATRRAIAGSTVTLPIDLSIERRRDRLERHIELEYDIDIVDVRMTDQGLVDRVQVGRRPTGLGSMLPPGRVAVAIRAEMTPDASLGDPIEIRSPEDDGRLITTGTLRGTDGRIATVIVDEEWADIDEERTYRLVTRPDDPTDSHEFAAALRRVDETVETLTVSADGPAAGEFVGWLPGRALLIDRDGELLPLPDDNETLEADDDVWILGSPDELPPSNPPANEQLAGEQR
ncbi:hypothetical protein [Natranaeroarchaeum aerophilus]|uniref:RCK C-terminal domain-containing protein n=1 Tax=Natranaeroarchaeum aerophilus TaxID=2917711 RepID=A0AAE3K413_9EURY|nr:hypothetical protein [Natranaeroarchaeum aerophilus]MCL9812893.1 hypothetical protein [Natranaeroarchaeum aerophilus]